MASVSVRGNAARDAELRFTPSGAPCLEFTIAENHHTGHGDSRQDDGTSWYRVSVWGPDAEALVERVVKGARVTVHGDLRVREYDTRDGGKGKSVDIRAYAVGVQPPRVAGMRPSRVRHDWPADSSAAPSTVQGPSKLGTNSWDEPPAEEGW